MDRQTQQLYEFGPFRLDPAERLLLREGRPVRLTPKAFAVLVMLVERGGRLVERGELMEALWPGVFVEEGNVDNCVHLLRKALGDGQSYIETVPKHGYRFVADVQALTNEGGREEIGSGPTEPVAAPTEATSVARPRPWELPVGFLKRRGRVALLDVLAAALGVGAIYFWRALTTPTAPVQPIRTIAVLPFKPLVQESCDEALELGIADTLIAKLSNSREFIVRPISSVRRYGGVEQDPAAAGRELGVEAVLDGTIQRSGDRVRVTARLTSVGDGGSLWAGQFDEKFTDIFAVQDSVSLRVAESLRPSLTGEERALLAKRYTNNAEAYNLYLKGRFFWDKRTRSVTTRGSSACWSV